MADRPKILIAEGTEDLIPIIKVVDHTPTKEDPYNHIHCDVCEMPLDRVVFFSERPEDEGRNLFVCKECLTKALALLS